MATQIISPAVPRDAATTHALALSLLEEFASELEKTYAVASGGVAYCAAADQAIQSSIFQVIEDRLAARFHFDNLRERINDLGRLAGVKVAL